MLSLTEKKITKIISDEQQTREMMIHCDEKYDTHCLYCIYRRLNKTHRTI